MSDKNEAEFQMFINDICKKIEDDQNKKIEGVRFKKLGEGKYKIKAIFQDGTKKNFNFYKVN